VGGDLNTGACSGITLTDDGAMADTASVSGTPTMAGTCAFTLRATDDNTDTDDLMVSFTVQAVTGGRPSVIGGGIF
jgi:hypothetical protein